MSTDNVAIKVTETGTRDVAAAFRAMTEAVNDNAKAVDELGEVTAKHEETHSEFRGHIRESKILIGELGRSFAGAIPGLKDYREEMVVTLGVFRGMTGLLEGGAGIAAGGLVALIAGLGVAWSESSKEANKLAAEAKKLNAELEKEATFEAQLEKLHKEKSHDDLYTRLATGKGSDQEYTAEINALYEKAKLALQQGNEVDAQEYHNKQVHYEALRQQAAEAHKKQLADDKEFAYAREIADADAAAHADAVKSGKVAGKNAAEVRELENRLEIQRIDEELAREKKRYAQLEEVQRLHQQHKDELLKQDVQFQNENQHVKDVIDGKEKISWAAQTAAFEKEQERRHQFSLKLQGELQQLGETGAQAFTKGLSDLAKVHKVAIGQIIEQLGDQLVARGTMTEFEGLSRALMSYGFDPTSEAMIALGAVEIGAGIALGAAGARGQGGSSSQQAGGGGGGATSRTQPTAATPLGTGASASAQPTVVNLSVHVPTVLSAGAEEGRLIDRAVRAAVRVYGRQAWGL